MFIFDFNFIIGTMYILGLAVRVAKKDHEEQLFLAPLASASIGRHEIPFIRSRTILFYVEPTRPICIEKFCRVTHRRLRSTILQVPTDRNCSEFIRQQDRPTGLVDKASVSGSSTSHAEDRRFESCVGR